MVLKSSRFELLLLKCIFEFMINTALQGSNSVNRREKYFHIFNSGVVVAWPSGQRPYFLDGGTVGVQVQIPGWLLSFFFFIVFLTFGFLTTDHVSFARVLRKHISSLICYLNLY